ncbi:unnamed protein product [Trichobilharzia regenti]|nr:unnamed protein product [Trichobilharzia regenti]
MVVVPNLLGLALWSPPIDRHGNSAKGIHFCQFSVEFNTIINNRINSVSRVDIDMKSVVGC